MHIVVLAIVRYSMDSYQIEALNGQALLTQWVGTYAVINGINNLQMTE